MLGYTVLLRAALETAKISLPTVIEARRGVLRQQDCDTRLRSWASRVLGHVDARVEVDGLEHLSASGGPFVVVSNHQSYFDIPVIYASLSLRLRMAAKAELFAIPLWGQALRASNFVLIDRKNPGRAHEALRDAGERMRESEISLYVAPEGTRSSDGALGRFKGGAFRMASQLGFPILPVAISGTYQIHRKGSPRVSRGCTVQVRVLPPLSPDHAETPEKWAGRARTAIETALEQLVRQSH
jgi:1-acyl-sn-glycerol-3-phosphate acyltransferase